MLRIQQNGSYLTGIFHFQMTLPQTKVFLTQAFQLIFKADSTFAFITNFTLLFNEFEVLVQIKDFRF